MPPLNATIVGLFGQVCVGVGVAFVVMIGSLALTRMLFGVIERDEDWNG